MSTGRLATASIALGVSTALTLSLAGCASTRAYQHSLAAAVKGSQVVEDIRIEYGPSSVVRFPGTHAPGWGGLWGVYAPVPPQMTVHWRSGGELHMAVVAVQDRSAYSLARLRRWNFEFDGTRLDVSRDDIQPTPVTPPGHEVTRRTKVFP